MGWWTILGFPLPCAHSLRVRLRTPTTLNRIGGYRKCMDEHHCSITGQSGLGWSSLVSSGLLSCAAAALDSAQTKEKYVLWTDKGNTAHIHEFTYNNSTFTVPSSGLYHIYLQITYRKPEKCNTSRGTIYLGPRVEVWRDSYPEFVSMMAASETLLCKDTIEKSIYTAGIYQLEKGSKLRVKYGTEDLAQVQADHTRMFFGAYLI